MAKNSGRASLAPKVDYDYVTGVFADDAGVYGTSYSGGDLPRQTGNYETFIT